MMQLTEEQRNALIEHAKVWIADADAARDEIPFGFDEDTEKEFSLIKIALAALTAEPVEYRVMREDAGIAGHCATLEDAQATVKNWNENWKIQPLYTAPPVPALRLPDEDAAKDMLKCMYSGRALSSATEAIKWYAGEVKHLNATAPPPVELPKYTQEVYPNHLLENQKIKSRNEAIGECADAIRAAGYQVEE